MATRQRSRAKSEDRPRMKELHCPECGKIFFRSTDLARTVQKCPACGALLTFDKNAGAALIKQVKYGFWRELAAAAAKTPRAESLHLPTVAARAQKLVGVKPTGIVTGMKLPRGVIAGVTSHGPIQLGNLSRYITEVRTAVVARKRFPFLRKSLERPPVRALIAHEIAHQTTAGRAQLLQSLRELRGKGVKGVPRGAIAKASHGPIFGSARRHVIKVMKKTVTMKELKKLGYAREDPQYVKTYFTEMAQHAVPFRTRMQWLSKIYGGRGGYTSEELYKIVTGKDVSGYYIFPFVKGAPSEVNRILERTYRKHRAAGDTKEAAAIASWTKVKQAGYVKTLKPAPTWVKQRSYTMKTMTPVTYGIGSTVGSMLEGGVRGVNRFVKRHPKVVQGAGLVGVGMLTQQALERRRRRRQPMYQLDVTHFTPDVPVPVGQVLREQLIAGRTATNRVVSAARTGAQALLIAMVAKKVLDAITAKVKPSLGPYMPEIRPDIELLSNFEVHALDQVVQYAGAIPSPALQMLKTKAGAAVAGVRHGVERGLLLWLMGFISAELLARGITTPKSKQEIILPQLVQQHHYALPDW